MMRGVVPDSFVAEYCYQPAIRSFGLMVWDFVPFPLVTIHLTDAKVEIPSIERKLGVSWGVRRRGPTLFSTSWRAGYREIECVEAFHIPWYLPLRTLGQATVPFGIRIRSHERTRARVMLFSRQATEMLEALAAHAVPVDAERRKLNFLFIGRK